MNGPVQQRSRTARLIRILAVPIILFWVAAMMVTNATVPTLEKVGHENAVSLSPQNSPALIAMKRVGEKFEQFTSDSVAMIVLEGEQPLGDRERAYYEGLVRDLVGEVGRDHDDAVAITENHVTGKHWRVAAADRNVDLDRLMQGEIGRRARPVMKRREAEPRDLGRVAEAAVGDDAGAAALHQPRHQDRTGRRRARILAAVHHQHRAHGTILDRLALRMRTIAEYLDRVEILPRRHVAQREGLADHGRLIRAQGMHILDHLDAEAALEQRGGNGGGGDGFQLVAGGVAEFGHGYVALSSFVIPGWPAGPGPESIRPHSLRRNGFRARASRAPE